MAKRTNKINEREREIVNMECKNLRDISEDLNELMDGDDIEFEKPIKTKWFDVHGITYMAVTDNEDEVIEDKPAFYLGDERHMEFIENVPYSVALNVYRSVFERQ